MATNYGLVINGFNGGGTLTGAIAAAGVFPASFTEQTATGVLTLSSFSVPIQASTTTNAVSPLEFTVPASVAANELLTMAENGTVIPTVTLDTVSNGGSQRITLNNVTIASAQVAGGGYAFSLDYGSITVDSEETNAAGGIGPVLTSSQAVPPGAAFTAATLSVPGDAPGSDFVALAVPGATGTTQITGYNGDFAATSYSLTETGTLGGPLVINTGNLATAAGGETLLVDAAAGTILPTLDLYLLKTAPSAPAVVEHIHLQNAQISAITENGDGDQLTVVYSSATITDAASGGGASSTAVLAGTSTTTPPATGPSPSADAAYSDYLSIPGLSGDVTSGSNTGDFTISAYALSIASGNVAGPLTVTFDASGSAGENALLQDAITSAVLPSVTLDIEQSSGPNAGLIYEQVVLTNATVTSIAQAGGGESVSFDYTAMTSVSQITDPTGAVTGTQTSSEAVTSLTAAPVVSLSTDLGSNQTATLSVPSSAIPGGLSLAINGYRLAVSGTLGTPIIIDTGNIGTLANGEALLADAYAGTVIASLQLQIVTTASDGVTPSTSQHINLQNAVISASTEAGGGDQFTISYANASVTDTGYDSNGNITSVTTTSVAGQPASVAAAVGATPSASSNATYLSIPGLTGDVASGSYAGDLTVSAYALSTGHGGFGPLTVTFPASGTAGESVLLQDGLDGAVLPSVTLDVTDANGLVAQQITLTNATIASVDVAGQGQAVSFDYSSITTTTPVYNNAGQIIGTQTASSPTISVAAPPSVSLTTQESAVSQTLLSLPASTHPASYAVTSYQLNVSGGTQASLVVRLADFDAAGLLANTSNGAMLPSVTLTDANYNTHQVLDSFVLSNVTLTGAIDISSAGDDGLNDADVTLTGTISEIVQQNTLFLTTGGVISTDYSQYNAIALSGGAFTLDANEQAPITVAAGSLTVAGGVSAAGVSLAAGTARLVVDPGAILSGTVQGSGDVLELASGSSAGTLNGLGSSIAGFGTVVFDAGAQWTLGGSKAGFASLSMISGFAVGDTLDIAGVGTETSATLGGNNLLTLTGGTSSATIQLDPASSFAGDVFVATADGHGGTDLTAYAVVPPSISGTVSAQTTNSEATLAIFAGVTLTDANAGATDTLTITLAGGGTLSGTGLAGSGGTYTLTGTAAAITAQLDALTFTPPATGTAYSTATTTVTLTDKSTAYATPTVDTKTSVLTNILPPLITLVTFNGTNGYEPSGNLIEDAAGNLFGTAPGGGTGNGADGEVFEITKSGAGYSTKPTILLTFSGSNGATPYSGLITDAAGNLFTIAQSGGKTDNGTLVEIAKSGSGYSTKATVLVNFTGGNGANPGQGPLGSLVSDSAGNLFGTTASGGLNNDGEVYELAKNGAGYSSAITVLTSFSTAAFSSPSSSLLIDASGDLFGTSYGPGVGAPTLGYGGVYEITKTGGSYSSTPTLLAAFNGTNGGEPYGNLIADAAGDLFGTTSEGGPYGEENGGTGDGEVFEIVKTANGYSSTPTILYAFSGTDGAYPSGGLIADAAGNLYGTTSGGGANGEGEVFKIAKTPTGYSSTLTLLASFNVNNGAEPASSLVADAAGDLFGTTTGFLTSSNGTVFEITNTGFVTAPPSVVTAPTGTLTAGQSIVIATVTPPAASDGLQITSSTLSNGGTLSLQPVSGLTGVENVVFTAPATLTASAADAISYTITDQTEYTKTTGAATVNLDAGPKISGTGTLTIGHGQTLNVTTLIDSYVTSGLPGDAVNITALAAARGTTVLATDSYTAPTSGTDTLTYKVANQYAQTASGTVSVTVDPGPALTTSAPSLLTLGQTAVIGTVTPGLAADTETLTVLTAPSYGTLGLSNGRVTYTETAAMSTGKVDSFQYAITDNHNDVSVIASPSITLVVPISATIPNGGTTATTDEAAVTPLQNVIITDNNINQTDTVTVSVVGSAYGTLSATAGGTLTGGVYTATGSPTQIQAQLAGLVFTPNAHAVAPGQTQTTHFSAVISDTDGQQTTFGSTFIATAVNDAPTITNTIGSQAVSDESTIAPFASISVTDPDVSVSDSAVITLSGSHGTLSGAGLTQGAAGTYVLAATTPASLTSELQSLVFTPTAHETAPGSSVTTGFTLAVSQLGTTTTDTTTSVIATAVNDAPTISGTMANQAVSDEATINPFASISVTDPDLNVSDSAVITLSGNHGTLSGAGLTQVAAGTYALAATTPTTLTSELQSLVFTPTAHEVAPGSSVTTSFALAVSQLDTTTTDTTTSVIATAARDAPTITGTTANQTTTNEAPKAVFSGVTVADTNNGAIDTLSITYAGPGTLSGSSLLTGSAGSYTLTGTAAAITTALDALVFTPVDGVPNTSVTTHFTLSDTSTAFATPTIDSTASITDTDPAVAPTIMGTVANQTNTLGASVQPFAGVTITDANPGQTERLTITPSTTLYGTLSDPSAATDGSVASNGALTLTGTSAQVQAELQALVFTPGAGQGTYGPSFTTGFTLSLADTLGLTATDSKTSVFPSAPLNVLVNLSSASGNGPYAGLIADAQGNLFGTTVNGGTNGDGTVFEITKTANGYASTLTILLSFDGSNGKSPAGDLVADANGNLFGTTIYGGANGGGTVFEIAKTANGYATTPTVLASFNGSNGANSVASLITDANGDLFGMTVYGGANGNSPTNFEGNGTVFEIAKTANSYASTPTILVSFNGSGGTNPYGGLIADANGNLFGTTVAGGASGDGTTFEIAKTANGYATTPTTLVNFSGSNGANPTGVLIADANGNLFGTTQGGGANGDGTVFEIVKTANGYASTPTVLVSFNGSNGDGPAAGLIADANGNLFGTTFVGGANGYGTVFEVARTANGYATTPTVLDSFSGSNGEIPTGVLIADANGDLFGTAEAGGTNNRGTVFEITKSGFAVNPVAINGTSANQPTSDQTPIDPFASVTITDPNPGQTETLTVTPSTTVYGTLSDPNAAADGSIASNGALTLTGTSAQVQAALQALVFTPNISQVGYGQSVTTGFTLGLTDTLGLTATDTATTVIDRRSALPTITGTVANQTTTSEAAIKPFAGVTIADTNSGATDTLSITYTGPGTLAGSTLLAGTPGNYVLSGTATAITAALDVLSFTAVAGVPNTSATTNFTLSDVSSALSVSVVDTTTTVTDTDPAVAPTITGAVANQTTTNEAPKQVFSGVTIADTNSGATDTLSIIYTGPGTLSGSSLLTGSAGNYSLTGTASAITTALNALSFTSVDGIPNTSVTTHFTLSDTSSAFATPTVNTTASITDTDPAVAPTITGAVANQTTTNEAPKQMFSGVTIADTNSGATDTLAITYTGPGTLAGSPLLTGSAGSYTLSGTASAVTAALRALSFTPVDGVPNTSVTTHFTLTDTSSAFATPTVNTTASITDTDPAVTPTITGTVANQITTNEAPKQVFSGVTIADTNSGATDTLSIIYTGPGTLSGSSLLTGSAGTYSLTGTASAITTALRALSFTPVDGVPNTSVTTHFTLSDTSTAFVTPTVDATASITDTDPAVASTITGTVANQTTTNEAPKQVFSGVTIADTNSGATDTLNIAYTGPGMLSGSSLLTGSAGNYSLTGTAAAVTAALRALSFTPVDGVPNTSVTTHFTLSDTSTAFATPTVNTIASITDTDPAVAPTITGAVANQTTTNEAPKQVFSGVTIADTNSGATDTLSIAYTGPGTLAGSSLLTGSAGNYSLTGTAAAVTAALRALSFTPVDGVPNTSVTTHFTLSDTSTAFATPTVNTTASITDTDPAVAPTITGAVANQTTSSEAAKAVFSGVTIADTNSGATDTLAITYTGPGTLAGSSLLTGSAGNYRLAGTAASITMALGALSFTPVDGVPNTSVTTHFTLSDTSTAFATSTVNTTASITDTDPAVASIITGAVANQVITDETTAFHPFATLVVTDPNGGIASDSAVITLSNQGVNGTLSGAGLTSSQPGVYTLAATSAATLTSELEALVFTPVAHQVTPGQSVATGFTVAVLNAANITTTNTTSSAAATAVNDAATISGTTSTSITDLQTAMPFSSVVIADPDNQTGVADTVTITETGAAAKDADGSLSGTGLTETAAGSGVYTLKGPLATVQAALRSVVFTPRQNLIAAGQSVTNGFSLAVLQASGTTSSTSALNTGTAVVERGTARNSTVVNLNGIFNTVSAPAAAAPYSTAAGQVITGSFFGFATIQGTGGSDTINAQGLFNTIYANGGNDVINAGLGNAAVSVSDGNGAVTVSGSLGNSSVTLGDGTDSISLGGLLNTITVGNGNDTISAGAGLDQLTAGSGTSTITLAGLANTVTLNGGVDTVNAACGDTININAANVMLKGGQNEVVFMGPGSSSLTDLSAGTTVVANSLTGNLQISDVNLDHSFVFDLTGGAGGYHTVQSVLSALHTDGHGGTLLALGTGGTAPSVDFINVAPSTLTASHFRIG